ncbi:hypothetical protein TCAL_05134 [Tigriopus californicus]|uniref:Protein sleepless n=1 Tax=Tigriopus californicus TaxID=6832 RepID=A0A553NCZ8_TIGCA|nr:uncharacterized protein LOC131888186 [Tigriopus californicus]TRY63229.1 hypothetical protein TCAL_05134 [Tigriopus californicus]|eukprot:TCALIF_05134-PA protein Name:"Protein of unknown function" AED:0.00 eAED:0.00 QI:61/1/1/1/0.5/0.66/3/33/127
MKGTGILPLIAFVALTGSRFAESANVTSCYKGVGLLKKTSSCDAGTMSCATVDTPVANTYFCGPDTNKTGCMDVNYAEVANAFNLSTTFKTCYCSTSDCNSFGMNIQPTGLIIPLGFILTLVGINVK